MWFLFLDFVMLVVCLGKAPATYCACGLTSRVGLQALHAHLSLDACYSDLIRPVDFSSPTGLLISYPFLFTSASLLCQCHPCKFSLIFAEVDHAPARSLALCVSVLLLKDLLSRLSFGKFPNMSGLLDFIPKSTAYDFSLVFALSFVTFCNTENLYKFHVVNSSVFPFHLYLERLSCPYVMQTYNKMFWCFI